MDSNESVVVHVSEEAHDELTIHSISHASVAGNRVAKVLDLECSLQSGSKETAERSNERSESCQIESVQLDRSKGDLEGGFRREKEKLRKLVGLGEEDWVGSAFKASEDVGAKVLENDISITVFS